jgi:hypothetical protein
MLLPQSYIFQIPDPFTLFPTLEAAHAWGLNQQRPPLSVRKPYERDAMQRYKGLYHRAINAHLRNDRATLKVERWLRRGYFQVHLEDDIEVLEEQIATSSIDLDVATFRGFYGRKEADFLLANVGGDFEDAGFVSVSLDPDYARGLLRRGPADAVFLTLLLPKGTPALYLEHISGGQKGEREKELLLLPRQVFVILDAQVDAAGVTHALLQL